MYKRQVHDPLHRRLITDDKHDEHRLWCVASYPARVRSWDAVVNMIHFCVPYGMNALSATIVIWKNARSRKRTRVHVSLSAVLSEQAQYHKHLIITPILIIVLSLPRLIISVLSGCVGTGRDSWLYLGGYVVSFIPVMLTFVLFVLPSTLFLSEFKRSIKTWRR